MTVGPEPHVSHMSLTARITLLSVGVALVAAALSGVAAARYVAAGERAVLRATETSTTTTVDPGTGRVGAPASPATPAVPAAPAAPATKSVRARVRAAIADSTRRPAQRVARAVLLSVGVGLVVGLGAGAGAARILTRPLRRTAVAAHAMGAGRRDVRVPVEGPREIADVADSLNGLADALTLSEGRQRRFLLSVSHELRTPLTAVRGYAESIADGVVTGADAVEAGRVVLAESERLERLVHDLLDLARIGADDFRLDLADIDVGRLFDDAATVWATRARGRGVELRVERPEPPGTVMVRTDAGRLRQVLDGLTENAVRMTPHGSPVVLALLGPRPTDPSGTRAVLQVRDGGPGLTPEDYAVAFEPGVLGGRYRDERPVGVGIGLSLVHGLVQRLGGGIAAEPAREGGACFTVVVRDAP